MLVFVFSKDIKLVQEQAVSHKTYATIDYPRQKFVLAQSKETAAVNVRLDYLIW